MVRLRMEQEIVRANSFTESLILVASQIFGNNKTAEEHSSIEDMESSIQEMMRGV